MFIISVHGTINFLSAFEILASNASKHYMYLQGAPDMAVLIEQTPGVTLLVAEVGNDSCD